MWGKDRPCASGRGGRRRSCLQSLAALLALPLHTDVKALEHRWPQVHASALGLLPPQQPWTPSHTVLKRSEAVHASQQAGSSRNLHVRLHKSTSTSLQVAPVTNYTKVT
jgi:hypothetical protein